MALKREVGHEPDGARERLALRCSVGQKEQIHRAAQIRGQSMTEFALQAVADAAWQTIRDHEVMTLSERDTVALFEAVLDPPAPNAALRHAAEQYAARVRAG